VTAFVHLASQIRRTSPPLMRALFGRLAEALLRMLFAPACLKLVGRALNDASYLGRGGVERVWDIKQFILK